LGNYVILPLLKQHSAPDGVASQAGQGQMRFGKKGPDAMGTREQTTFHKEETQH